MVPIADIYPGMKVKLVKTDPNTYGEKLSWLGEVVTVKTVFPNGRKSNVGADVSQPCFNVVEDTDRFSWGCGWPWYAEHIECIVDDGCEINDVNTINSVIESL